MPYFIRLVAAVALLLPAPAPAQVPSQAPPVAEVAAVTIVLAGDIDRMGADAAGRGGFAKLAAVIAAERGRAAAAGGTVLALHAGDTISPSLLASFDKGAHVVALINASGIDAAVLGNHEFDFGPSVLAERLREARFPWLAANVRDRAGALLTGTVERWMAQAGPFKIGIVGLVTPDTAIVSSPGPDIVFAPPQAAARAQAGALRAAGADLVVALAHLPLAEDLALARGGHGIDLVLSGHDHVEHWYYDGVTAALEAGEQAARVAVLDLDIRRETREGRAQVTWRPTVRFVDTASVAPERSVAALVAGFEAGLSAALDAPLAPVEAPLDSRRAVVRGQEAAIGNLIADAMREAVGADAAIMNGGGIRAERQHAAGSVLTGRDVAAELPFPNKVVKLRLSGSALRAALENGVSQVAALAGRFPQVSGIAFAYDPARAAGQRVTAASVGGKPLDPQAFYTLATNDFLARGGDGYDALKSAEVLIDGAAGRMLSAVVSDAIRAAGRVAHRVEGRIRTP